AEVRPVPCKGCLNSALIPSNKDPDPTGELPVLKKVASFMKLQGHLQAISYVSTGSAGGTANSTSAITSRASDTSNEIHMARGAEISGTSPGNYSIMRGTVMIRGNQAITVNAPNCIITAPKDTAFIVSVARGITRLLDVVDPNNAIRMQVGKRIIALRSGSETDVVTDPKGRAQERVWADGLARRNVEVLFESDSIGIVQGEFSFVSALGGHPLMQELRESNDKKDQQLLSRIMKSAAAVQVTLDRIKGPYVVPMEQEQTASVEPKPTL
ncbi:MAG: hypothetical protein K2X81_09955, partial [Candidatus Obscuribacterales bacterium]|nr:hypothetical protein [Candidatus Obscuribacterales bacterium]